MEKEIIQQEETILIDYRELKENLESGYEDQFMIVKSWQADGNSGKLAPRTVCQPTRLQSGRCASLLALGKNTGSHL